MPRSQTMLVRMYKDTRHYERDAQKLARQGWQVVSTTERRPRAGCLRILTLGFSALLRPPKPELVVTYERRRG